MKRIFKILLLLLSLSGIAKAIVKPNTLFSDNAVLQQGVTIPVWGKATGNEKVSVEFANQKVSTIAKNGKWMVKLNPIKAGGPYTMTIKGENSIEIKNILVGEVWVCSGQSNMERQLGPRWGQPLISNWKDEAAEADYPFIREFNVPQAVDITPQEEVNSKWVVCNPQSVKDFSAVAYFFGRDLFKKLNVPIGLIHTSWGGTPAEFWLRKEAFANYPELEPILKKYQNAINQYPKKLEQDKAKESAQTEQWQKDSTAAAIAHKNIPYKPWNAQQIYENAIKPCGGLYNAMIAPLIPYAMKGVIWYQGEANADRAKEYRTLFAAMIADWRREWKIGDFPFLFVQIAPNKANTPELREAQLLTWKKTPNTAMAVATDCVDSTFDIHPPHKQLIGMRLALAARAIAYREKIEYSGPVYKSMKVKGDKVILSFTHIGSGLEAKDGDLKGFYISGEDKIFFPAKAEIKGSTVIVSVEKVKKPKAVRFGFSNIFVTNLYNKEGLLASPFRTDIE